jgi:LmbE family N-acetylglucosaminyl deacetylase
VRTVVVTCTDGRCGDGPDHVKPGEPGHDQAAVVAHRRTELEASCAVLKVSDLELLGYGDSGMMGWPQNDAPGAFWGTPVPEAAARLAGLIEEYQPDVIVTYDENGFYGHPDHIQAHRVTMAAVASTGTGAKVYWSTAPRSFMERMGERMREAGLEEGGDVEEAIEPAEPQGPPIGLPDEEISTWVDVREWVDQKYEALICHSSQSDVDFFLRFGKEAFGEFMGIECYSRVDRDPEGQEDDLFSGLR